MQWHALAVPGGADNPGGGLCEHSNGMTTSAVCFTTVVCRYCKKSANSLLVIAPLSFRVYSSVSVTFCYIVDKRGEINIRMRSSWFVPGTLQGSAVAEFRLSKTITIGPACLRCFNHRSCKEACSA